ncbi:hypothetical protein OHV93_12780 [Acinetobacter baumannii]|nr:hypothetical protein [Acinetobacter baumannii]MDC4933289.1 hypothetical protein [Acinetobacter baumannii]
MISNVDRLREAQQLLGLYKAEWLSSKLFDYFNEPGYFSELKTNRPCVLIGGRGTGKTTVLRGLSYQGQYAIQQSNSSKIQVKDWDFFGIYYRVNTNRVTTFQGTEVTNEKWNSYFAHYINLCFSQELLKFALWFESVTNEKINISQRNWRKILKVFHFSEDIQNLEQLDEELEICLLEFEASINQIVDNPPRNLTMQGAPIDILSEALINGTILDGKQFFFLIDEFENFHNYQQKILNTLIKHNNNFYTFKVGVRELGFRERATLNNNEQLTSPADYVRVDLSEIFQPDTFKEFAELVINSRLNHSASSVGDNNININKLLGSLTQLEEANLLLDGDHNKILEDLKLSLSNEQFAQAKAIQPGYLYFIKYWSEKEKKSLDYFVLDWLKSNKEWKTRINNHFYASLFAIREGKAGIRKYYNGWDTFLSLANGNIRYLLELVHATLQEYLNEIDDVKKEEHLVISPRIQTLAAIQIGKKNLSELEGLSVEGAKLTKLLLSLGRVFGVLASKPLGHTPEANQFYVQSDSDDEIESTVKLILDQAVMHLALIRQPGNKLTGETDTKDYDYMIHPIFSPFFVFSYRRKRKISLSSSHILKLVNYPKIGIKDILSNSNRSESVVTALPDQLQLFGEYYGKD